MIPLATGWFEQMMVMVLTAVVTGGGIVMCALMNRTLWKAPAHLLNHDETLPHGLRRQAVDAEQHVTKIVFDRFSPAVRARSFTLKT